MEATEQIKHLIYPFTTVEVLPPPRGEYMVEHPALIDQIEQTVTGSTLAGQIFHSAYGSKPAGRLDSIAFLAKLDKQSKELALEYGIGLKPVRQRLADLAQALGRTQHALVSNWWISARVLTQHDGPALSLNVPCPEEVCDMRGSLRVRFNPNLAFCVNCGATWSEHDTSFGRLVVWVQWAADHLSGPEHAGCQECLAERKLRSERHVKRMMATIGKMA